MFRLLPWEYGVRNLFRRASRSVLTVAAIGVVVLMVLVVVGFIRGLERSLAISGDPRVMLIYSMTVGADLENSAIPARTPDFVAASLQDVASRYGIDYVSPEMYLATRIKVGEDGNRGLAVVRGVTRSVPLVRQQTRLLQGEWPGPGEVLVGRLAYSKLGCEPEDLTLGHTVTFENQTWKVAGIFTADGSAFESELWADLSELQSVTKRQDISLVAVAMSPGAMLSDVELFCQERPSLELQAKAESNYYGELQEHYGPLRMLGWVVVLLITGAGIFAGINTMYGAVVGRASELATLQAIGFRRRSLLVSLVQEATLMAASGSLLAAAVALCLVNGMAVRFSMGAFTLQIDSVCLVIGCSTGLALGVLGALPPAIKAMRQLIVTELKAV